MYIFTINLLHKRVIFSGILLLIFLFHETSFTYRIYEDGSRKGSCIIQNLEEVLVRSKSDVYNVIAKGSAKRQTAATLMNAHSSRSHTVFTVTVHIKENTLDGDELLKVGILAFSFCFLYYFLMIVILILLLCY